MLPEEERRLRSSSVNTGRNSNIFAFDAARALEAHAAFAEGTTNSTFAVVSTQALEKDARTALASSAERLGYGKHGILWVRTTDDESHALDAHELKTLLMACDPLVFVVTDAEAAHMLEQAFEEPCPPNAASRFMGRCLVAFSSFSAMLQTDEQKQRAWALLKRLA